MSNIKPIAGDPAPFVASVLDARRASDTAQRERGLSRFAEYCDLKRRGFHILARYEYPEFEGSSPA